MASFESPAINSEYARWTKFIGPDDPYAGPTTLGIHDVLRAHFHLADYFMQIGEGLGDVGPRDSNLLHSAMSRQGVEFGAARKWESPYEIAATLFYGIIKDHPFHDANKRTAFLCLLYHLEKCGKCPTCNQEDLENLAVDVAENALVDKYARCAELKRDGNPDPEVRFVAHFLKQNTRRIDKENYDITYRELQTRLSKFGLGLENPHGNYIDVVRYEEQAGFLGLGKKRIVPKKIKKIGFPGWSKQVDRNTVNHVREAAGLILRRGKDSETFFKTGDPIHCLIGMYQEPLRRLANR